VVVRARYPVTHIGDAHRDVERGHGRGKVVVTVPEMDRAGVRPARRATRNR
jgi:hypothetical protein